MSLRTYLGKNNTARQVLFFFAIGQFALLLQIISRIIIDNLLKTVTTPVNIAPFPAQPMGSFVAFLVSNLLAKTVSYVLNLKNFRSKGSKTGFVIYTVMIVAFLVIEAAAGTPLQNFFYRLFNGKWTGQLSTSTALNPALYQTAGSLAIISAGLVDSIICFVMDKFVIMKETPSKEAEPDRTAEPGKQEPQNPGPKS